MADVKDVKYVVVGGGIAGVTCAETLSSMCGEEDKIVLITASPLIKAVTNFKMVTKTLEEFDVEEKPMCSLKSACPNTEVIHGAATRLCAAEHILETSDGSRYRYGKLCICAGGTPKVIANENAHILGIRDTESVKKFQQKLKDARRLIVVGNGGIATELVHEVEGVDVVWAIKDSSISHAFVDAGAATFFMPQLAEDKDHTAKPLKRHKYTVADANTKPVGSSVGGALGPDWASGLSMAGTVKSSHRIHVEYQVEVSDILTPVQYKKCGKVEEQLVFKDKDGKTSSVAFSGGWPVYVRLTNGKLYGCDLIISATGVIPNIQPFVEGNDLKVSDDGGILVDDKMQTSVPDVYAAGDVCTAGWEPAPQWIQMRLWSQARQMGHYAGKCMIAHNSGEDIYVDFCFELFSHVTKFFGYKVILLGLFNAQGLGDNHELLLRVSKGMEYVKVVMKDGRMQGCILVGETDLEETFENLILNQMDLSVYGEDLLDPGIDIEDYFD